MQNLVENWKSSKPYLNNKPLSSANMASPNSPIWHSVPLKMPATQHNTSVEPRVFASCSKVPHAEFATAMFTPGVTMCSYRCILPIANAMVKSSVPILVTMWRSTRHSLFLQDHCRAVFWNPSQSELKLVNWVLCVSLDPSPYFFRIKKQKKEVATATAVRLSRWWLEPILAMLTSEFSS